jgi:stage V sporulation protein B
MIEQRIREVKKRAVRNSVFSLASSIIVKIGGLALTIILARMLLPEKYGIYSIVLSIAMIFYTLSDFGVNSAFLRYGSYAATHERKKLPAYRAYLARIKIKLALASSAIMLVAAYPLAHLIIKNDALLMPLVASAFYILVLGLESFYTQIYYISEKLSGVAIKETLNQTLRIGLAMVSFFLLASRQEVLGIYASLTIASLIMLGFTLYYTKKALPEIYQKSIEVIDKKRVKRFIYFTVIYSLSTVVFGYVDSVLLAFFINPEFVGYYRAAFTLIWGFTALMAFPNVVLLKLFTDIDDKKRLKSALDQIIKFYFIIIMPGIALILALSRYIIRILYGYEYLQSTPSLMILSLMILPAVLAGLIISLFSAKDKPEIFTKLTVMISAVNIIINVVLIKIFLKISPLAATIGASIAVSASWFIYLAANLYYVRKELGFGIRVTSAIKPLSASIILYFCANWMLKYWGDITILSGLTILILSGLIYIALIFAFRTVRKSEINFIIESLRIPIIKKANS